MTSREVFELFRTQLQRLSNIAENIPRQAAATSKPSDALAFAESLLLCLTDDGAKSQMQLDHKGAVAFFQIANFLEKEYGERGIPTVEQPLKDAGPFFVATSCVQDYLHSLKRAVGDDWR